MKQEWFLISKELVSFGKKVDKLPVYSGIYLGTKKNDYFVPSTLLLDMLAKSKHVKKVFVNDKAAWLFTKKKNVIDKSIINTTNNPEPGDWVLVMAPTQDCIGFGEYTDKNVVRNLFDIGDFLRRERRN
jgi:ribosome biogenesis protein Nip4